MFEFDQAVLRVARRHLDSYRQLIAESDPEKISRKKLEQQVRRLLTQTVISRIRSAFGQIGMPFFQFYVDLRRLRLGLPVVFENELSMEFQVRARHLMRTGLSAPVANSVQEAVNEVKPWLRQIARNPENVGAWRQSLSVLVPLIVLVARDKEVFLKTRKFGSEGWAYLQAMRKVEEDMERVRDTDPALYDVMVKYRGDLATIDEKIKERIKRSDLKYKRRFMFGRTVHIGEDPVTGEELVYDQVEVVPVVMDDYVSLRKREIRQLAKQTRVFPGQRALNQMRMVSDEELAALPGSVEYASLTDDKAKQGGLTRIYPVKTTPEGRQVIVSGRFKGLYLDSMVNAAGRMIEGTAYNFDPKSNRVTPIELRDRRGGVPTLRVDREPYVTKAPYRGGDKLYLKIPASKAFTEARNELRKLATLVPSVVYLERTRNSEFFFEPKDFESVRAALAGMAMSESAAKLVREHFEVLAAAEQATAKENLSHYELGALGGFKTNRVRETPLLTKQKQALAWMEARGNNGVCALDTGLGKTVTGICMMQKLKRDGLWEEDEGNNGRYLYVCPKALKGNIIKEIRAWLQEVPARELIDRLDVMTYRQFGNARRKNSRFAENYIAVFFDEAQELKNVGGKRSTTRAALALKHPRKILLTASPLEKEPTEAYVLAAVSNNVDLGDPEEGPRLRREMRKFQDRFAEKVGGRIVGVKDDPLIRREVQTWVKQNIFYAEKTDVEEFLLPELTRQTIVVTMPKEVENAYRAEMQEIRGAMRGMVALFRDQGRDVDSGRIRPETRDKNISRIFTPRLARLLKRLFVISNNPEKIVPNVVVRTPEGQAVFDPLTGDPMTAPTPNPKIEEAIRLIAQDRSIRGARTLMFTDNPDFVVEAARQVSLKMPGLYHVAAGARRIDLFRDGMPVEEFAGHGMPFREKNYKLIPDAPAGSTNPAFRKAEWQTFVFKEIVNPNPQIATATLQGQVYQVGQNLQSFGQVIHLDRDTWNSEDMKQRTARAWRQGQKNPVKEFTIDMVYDAPVDEFDRTMDEIRRYVQELDEEMFNRIIKEAQILALGQEYFDMRRTQAKFYDLDRKSLEIALSPYLDQSDVPKND